METKKTFLMTVKHCYHVAAKDGWKVEVWLSGAEDPVWYPVDVWIRLTPEDEKKTAPKMKVNLQIQRKGGEGLRKGEFAPPLEDCATKPKCKEYIYKDGFGPAKDFPPKERCLEACLLDAFKSDRRKEKVVSFEAGSYEITGQIALEPGPKLAFTLPPLKLYVGKDVRPGD